MAPPLVLLGGRGARGGGGREDDKRRPWEKAAAHGLVRGSGEFRWVRLRARWVTLRARWVSLRARWVSLRARWVAAQQADAGVAPSDPVEVREIERALLLTLASLLVLNRS